MQQAKTQVKKKLSFVLQVDDNSLNESSSEDEDTKKHNELKKKSEDLDYFMDTTKQKLKSDTTRREKIQLLTMSWSHREVAEKLDVSEYLVGRREKGILAIPELKQGRKLPEETILTVKQFYEDDEFS